MPTVPELIDFEAAHPRRGGAKEHAIRQTFGVGMARYYQLLIRAANTVEAQQHDPITTRRIQDTTRSRHLTRTERRTS